MAIKKIGVLTSGGDAPGMNAAIRAVARACAFYNIECIGVIRGYQGMIENQFMPMGPRDVRNIVNRGGTVLRTARSKEFMTREGRQKACENLKAQEIDALVVIGGDGSFTGAQIFNQEFGVPVIGIPGTIDNDICGTSHTLGYDTALNSTMEIIDKIRDTASSHSRLFFVEVMGRNAGHIAVNAGIAGGAEEIIIPEEDFSFEDLQNSLSKSKAAGKLSSIVVVCEGKKPGEKVFAMQKYAEENMPGYDVRVSVLGHIVRGGPPSCFDRVMAARLGVASVEALLKGETNVMAGLVEDKVVLVPLDHAIHGNSIIDPELIKISKIISV